MNNILVIGLGSYGSAITKELLKNRNNDILTFTRNPSKSIDKYFNESNSLVSIYSLDRLHTFNDLCSLTNITVIIGLPTSAFSEHFNEYSDFYSKLDNTCNIINLAKGVVEDQLAINYLISKLCNINRNLSKINFSTLLGPSFSSEVELGPIGLTYTSTNISSGINNLVENTNIILDRCARHEITSLMTIMKNVYAIVMGIVSNETTSVSSYHLVLTNIIKEYSHNITLVDFSNNYQNCYAGIGDLLLTSSSNKSRNRVLGEMIANGLYNSDQNSGNIVFEGLRSIKYLVKHYPNSTILIALSNLIENKITKNEFMKIAYNPRSRLKY